MALIRSGLLLFAISSVWAVGQAWRTKAPPVTPARIILVGFAVMSNGFGVATLSLLDWMGLAVIAFSILFFALSAICLFLIPRLTAAR